MVEAQDAIEPEDGAERDVTSPWESDQREVLRATFDQDAEAYDRSRPVAPDDVFDEALRLASLAPGSTVVEIGPGTGQATRFDAVFACNSFHWIDPVIRFTKAAAVLRAGGHLVVLATPWVIPETADRFWWDVQDDWESVGLLFDPSTMHPDLIVDLAPVVRASGVFEEPTITRRLFEVTFTADGYATNLSTQSGVKKLPENARADLVARVHQRVQGHGGRVTAHLLAMLTVARRAENPRP